VAPGTFFAFASFFFYAGLAKMVYAKMQAGIRESNYRCIFVCIVTHKNNEKFAKTKIVWLDTDFLFLHSMEK